MAITGLMWINALITEGPPQWERDAGGILFLFGLPFALGLAISLNAGMR